MNLEEIRTVRQEAELLCDRNQVQQAIDAMAEAITARLAAGNPVCLCVMTGGIVLGGQLLTRLDFPLQLDYVHATRYRGATQGGKDIHWPCYPRIDLQDRTVLVIDDILDEGLTLQVVLDYCRQQGAREVLSAVLVDKQRPRAPGGLGQADFTGLHIPNRYVFGYGLDYHSYLRNADGIYAVKGL